MWGGSLDKVEAGTSNREESFTDLQQHLRVLLDELVRRETVWKAELEDLVKSERRLRQRIDRDKIQAERLQRTANSLELMLRADTEEEVFDVVSRTMNGIFPDSTVRFLMVSSSRIWLEGQAPGNGGREDCGSCSGVRSSECWAVRLGKAFVSAANKRLHCRMIEEIPGVGGAACLPLLADGWVMGVLSLLVPSPLELEKEDLEFLELYSNSIAIVLFNLRQRNSLQALSLMDQLTELPNRRFILTAVEREIVRASRSGKQFALAMLDLDNFKDVNDRYGHEEGDRVLSLLARIGRETLRGSDALARWGGEEFLLLLPEVGPEGARAAVERFRQNFAKSTAAENGLTAKGITFSAGLTMFPEDGKSLPLLLEKADRRLYRAKQEGRNRLVGEES